MSLCSKNKNKEETVGTEEKEQVTIKFEEIRCVQK